MSNIAAPHAEWRRQRGCSAATRRVGGEQGVEVDGSLVFGWCEVVRGCEVVQEHQKRLQRLEACFE